LLRLGALFFLESSVGINEKLGGVEDLISRLDSLEISGLASQLLDLLLFCLNGQRSVEVNAVFLMEVQSLLSDNAFSDDHLDLHLRAHLSTIKSDDLLEQRDSQESELLHGEEKGQ